MSNGNPAYEELQARLAQAEALLVALQSGKVDAVISNANVCSRLLASPVLDVDEVREAVADIAEAGTRASDVIARIRTLLQKAGAEKTRLDINEVIQEVLALTRSDLYTHQVAVQTELRPGLPPVLGDRVQLQQVILNLMMNGIEAMTEVTNRPRVLVLRSWAHESGNVLVTVQDSGVGLDPQHEVFPLVTSGLLNKQIAAALGTSEKTIKSHRSQVMQKMQAESLADLVRMAETLGLPAPKS